MLLLSYSWPLFFMPTFVLLLLSFILFSQNPKPPEAFDDYAETIEGGRVSISVLENDFCEEGHQMVVFMSGSSDYASTEHSDSTVIYLPDLLYLGQEYPTIDTVSYLIKDLDNGLTSEFAYIYITIHEISFDKAKDSLSMNNYNATFAAFGNYFYDYLGSWRSKFEIPQGSGKFTLKESNLIIGGKEGNYHYVVSGQSYFSWPYILYNSDFWPGPFSFTSIYTLQQDSAWNKIWKLTHDEISFHSNNWQEAGYQPINAIRTWPGNGNIAFGHSDHLAPFNDLNNNGIYEPFMGDSPAIVGDETVFTIYNDNRTVGLSTFSDALGVEVHQMSYVFDCPFDSAFYNTLFINYTIINKSAHYYTDLFCGIMTDFQIGKEGDDYFGCDTTLNCYFGYNDSIDEYIGYTPAYGAYPPAQAICFLNHKMYAFIDNNSYYGNFGSTFHYNALRGLWSNTFGSEPMTYGGDGHGGTDTTTYLYPGNPSDPQDWSNLQTNPTQAFYKKGVGSVGPFTLSPEDTIKLDIAYVFARDYGGTNLSSVNLMKERVETIRWYYDNDSTPCGASWSGVEKQNYSGQKLKIYPNPCKDYINIDVGQIKNEIVHYDIFDLSGKNVSSGIVDWTNKEISVHNLKGGFYIIKVKNKHNALIEKFIKLD